MDKPLNPKDLGIITENELAVEINANIAKNDIESITAGLTDNTQTPFATLSTDSIVSTFQNNFSFMQSFQSDWLNYTKLLTPIADQIKAPNQIYSKSAHDAVTSWANAISAISIKPISILNDFSQLDIDASRQITESSLSFSTSYLDLYKSVESSWEIAGSINNFDMLSQLPAIELINQSTLLDSFSAFVPDRNTEKVYQTDSVDVAELEPVPALQHPHPLDELLLGVDVELWNMWQGALHALESGHADSARHFCISFRELFTQLIHELAPDEAVMSWSTAPGHLRNGRPTRAARLLYICRNVNQAGFSDFVEKDVEAAVAFFSLFQPGTHERSSPFTLMQLKAMKARMEGLLYYVLTIEEHQRLH